MIEGRISDFHSYQKDVGIAQGLEDACIIIDETLTSLDEGDEEPCLINMKSQSSIPMKSQNQQSDNINYQFLWVGKY